MGEQDDHEQAKRALDKNSSPKDPDDSNGAPPGTGGDQSNGSQAQPGTSTESKNRRDSKSKETSSSSGERRSSKDSKDRHHHHHRDHKDHRDHHKDHNRHRGDHKDRDYKRSSSSSGGDHGSHHHSSSHHKKSHKKDKERHGSSSDRKSTSSSGSSDHKDHKHQKSEKSEKTKQKLAEIEAQVKKTSEQRLKSDRFQGFDMFAPKTPKLQVKKPPLHLNQTPKQIFTPPSPVIGASGTPTSAGSVSLKSVPSSPGTPVSTSGSKPVFSEKKAANASTSNTPSTQNSTPVSKKEIPKGSSSNSKEKKARRSSETGNPFIVHEPRKSQKIYPELPVPQTEGVDKERQHNDDIAETKRLLQLARQRKMDEMKKEKEMKRQRKKSTSKSSPNKLATQKSIADKTDSNSADSADDVKRYDSTQPDSPKSH